MAERPVISFRADPEQCCKLEQLRASFPKQQWAEVFTWLLTHPQVQALIRDQVGVEAAEPRPPEGWTKVMSTEGQVRYEKTAENGDALVIYPMLG
jgi:hypothetical protein